jgi:lysophospholipase L1-like esterase
MKASPLSLLLLGLFLGGTAGAGTTASSLNATADKSVVVPASDPRFVYEGRFDRSGPAAPAIIWQGSRIRIDFEGDALALEFGDLKGQSFFDASIDGHESIVALRAGLPAEGREFSHLGAGRHSLVLFKRSEAAAGTARFRGITLGEGALAAKPALPAYKVAFQFVGDSITVGACNEDGAADQWEDRRTHNNARSYGAFTAAAFGADYRNIAVSGMGIVTGWVDMKAGEIWDRVYPVTSSPRADLTDWTPHVLFVNLGENDDSFTKAKDRPFPSQEFTDGYIALVNAIRGAYPKVHIVILRGGMYGGAKSDRLRVPWQAAVKKLEESDPRVSHFVFTHWSNTHPRVADHRAMADELIAWLNQQAFMSAYR